MKNSVARWPIYRPLWPKMAYFEGRWHIFSEKIGHIEKVAYVAYFCRRSGILWPISKNCGLSHFFSTLSGGNDATKSNIMQAFLFWIHSLMSMFHNCDAIQTTFGFCETLVWMWSEPIDKLFTFLALKLFLSAKNLKKYVTEKSWNLRLA